MFSEFQNPYEDIEFHSRSIGQTKPWHNQTARFSNVTDMVRYVCVEMDAGVQGNFAQWNYIPICEFPYAPKGWIDDGVPGNSDVKFGDCSILLSDAMPSYNQECFNLAIIAIIPLLFSTFFLKLSNDKKLKKDRAKHFWMPKNPNLNDKMLSINIVIGVFHALRCIDPSGYANRLTLKNFHTVFTGMCVACPQHIGFLLVESWITIVDGGKNKKTPRWAQLVCNFCIGFSYFGEVVGGLVEYRTGQAVNYSGALDGRITSSKYAVAVINCVVIGVLCFIYGSKITAQLSGGKGKTPNPQFKRIRKMCYLTCVIALFGAWVKFQGIFNRNFRLCQALPGGFGGGCKGGPDLLIPVYIYVLQYGITWTCQPPLCGKKKNTKVVDGSGKKMFGSTDNSTGTSSGDTSSNTSSTASSSSTSSMSSEMSSTSSSTEA